MSSLATARPVMGFPNRKRPKSKPNIREKTRSEMIVDRTVKIQGKVGFGDKRQKSVVSWHSKGS